ncbi:MAG: peptidylprolyl isomerase [Planctomycetes bacterium]|nr:peptidylprolyl isomerase [Planctomycetota bacterium]
MNSVRLTTVLLLLAACSSTGKPENELPERNTQDSAREGLSRPPADRYLRSLESLFKTPEDAGLIELATKPAGPGTLDLRSPMLAVDEELIAIGDFFLALSQAAPDALSKSFESAVLDEIYRAEIEKHGIDADDEFVDNLYDQSIEATRKLYSREVADPSVSFEDYLVEAFRARSAANPNPTLDEVREFQKGFLRKSVLQRLLLEYTFLRMGWADVGYILYRTREDAIRGMEKIDAGMSFSTIARRDSLDREVAEAGGRFGPVIRGKLQPEFDSATFSAEVGKHYGPVRVDDGYVVGFLFERHDARDASFAEVEDELLAHFDPNKSYPPALLLSYRTALMDEYKVEDRLFAKIDSYRQTRAESTVIRSPVNPDAAIATVGGTEVTLAKLLETLSIDFEEACLQSKYRLAIEKLYDFEIEANNIVAPTEVTAKVLADWRAEQNAIWMRDYRSEGVSFDEFLISNAQLPPVQRFRKRPAVVDELMLSARDSFAESIRRKLLLEYLLRKLTWAEVGHILCASESHAGRVAADLEDGAIFTALARRESIDREVDADGGIIGTVFEGTLSERFENDLFAAKPLSPVGPFKTKWGYEILTSLTFHEGNPDLAYTDVSAAIVSEFNPNKRYQRSIDRYLQVHLLRTHEVVDLVPDYFSIRTGGMFFSR